MSDVPNYFRLKELLDATDPGNERLRGMRVSHAMLDDDMLLRKLKNGETIVISRERAESILKDLESLVP